MSEEKIDLFDRLDNTIGNHMEGYATDEDLLKIAYEVNHYLVKQRHYTEADLVSFGNFLGIEVTHADLENWKNEKR